jgi:hypothetical protein
MKFRTAIFNILILPALLAGCTEKIDIKLDDSYTRLVVDGAISTDTMAHTVLLSMTSDYYYNKPAPMVSGATISITDGNLTFNLKEVSPGVYKTAATVYGITGKTYTLNIRLATLIGGYTDYEAISTLYPVTQLDSVSLLLHPDWSTSGIWEVKCYVQDPPTVDYYRFMVSKDEKMVSDTLNEWFVTDDKFFNGNYAYGATIAYLEQDLPEVGLRPGDKITVEMNSIGKEYAGFLQAAQTELFGSNPLFSGPPANVIGNINNGAVGFFAAYSATRASSITPDFK